MELAKSQGFVKRSQAFFFLQQSSASVWQMWDRADIAVDERKILCYYIVEIATLYVQTKDCMSRQRSKDMLASTKIIQGDGKTV